MNHLAVGYVGFVKQAGVNAKAEGETWGIGDTHLETMKAFVFLTPQVLFDCAAVHVRTPILVDIT